jgi:hypothetical protein
VDSRSFVIAGWMSLCSMVACGSDGGAPSKDEAGDESDAAVSAVLDASAGTSMEPAPRVADCARGTLRSLVDAYFEALAQHDATRLPLAPDAKFTENGARLELGQGLWQKAGPVQYKRSAIDPESCATHTQATLEEDGVAVIFGVRLQLKDGLINEVETFVVRPEDYYVFGLKIFSTDLAASDNVSSLNWEEPVPDAQRATRDELVEIAHLYFESFGLAGIVAPIRNDCYRWEDGYQTTFGDCSLFLPEPGTVLEGGITHRRYDVVDVENGIAVGYVLFQDRVDFHMFKIVDGEIRLIQAVLSATGHTSTGWEEREAAYSGL